MTPEERAAEETRRAAEAESARLRQEATAKAAEDAKRRELGLVWQYEDNTDDLSGKHVRFASVRSQNEVRFDFPYQGAQRAMLQLRKHPKFGNDVILQIPKGQFVCGVEDCTVSVRFDDGPVQQFSAAEAEDHSSNLLFVTNYSRFVQRVVKAKRAYISAVVYQEGSPTFEFNVEGLDWK
jgi:hypothetical protein